MIHNGSMFGLRSKYDSAIERLKAFEPADGYYLAFSGGKDSQAVYHLAVDSGVKFEAHYHVTTVDPPELVRFIKANYPDVIFDKPKMSMWELIVKTKLPPTRLMRYCCDVLKEGHGQGRTVITGVRWGESSSRRNRALLELNAYSKHQIRLNNDNDEARRVFEVCQLKSKHILNPIVEWNEKEVWEYLNGKNLPHCCLYDEGATRIGCIGCPMAGTKGMMREFERWPKYREAYMRAFDRMLEARRSNGMTTRWANANEVMNWWLSIDGNDQPRISDLMSLDDFEVLNEEVFS